jgi:hypothetical protein
MAKKSRTCSVGRHCLEGGGRKLNRGLPSLDRCRSLAAAHRPLFTVHSSPWCSEDPEATTNSTREVPAGRVTRHFTGRTSCVSGRGLAPQIEATMNGYWYLLISICIFVRYSQHCEAIVRIVQRTCEPGRALIAPPRTAPACLGMRLDDSRLAPSKHEGEHRLRWGQSRKHI